MAQIQITQFNIPQDVDGAIHLALKTITQSKSSENISMGSHIKDKHTLQVTSQQSSPYSLSLQTLQESLGPIKSQLLVHLTPSPFSPSDGSATAPIVENVRLFFPVSKVTPEFMQKIEGDFWRFDSIFKDGVKGNVGCTIGWSVEDVVYEGFEGGEMAKVFYVMRGWERMEDFEKSVTLEGYAKAVPILFGWGAPFEMWHVERIVV